MVLRRLRRSREVTACAGSDRPDNRSDQGGSAEEVEQFCGVNGIARKVMMFLLVGIANLIDKEFHTEVLRDGVAFFYVANEGLSIIENAIEMNAPVPEALKERFLSWRNRQLLSKNDPADSED